MQTQQIAREDQPWMTLNYLQKMKENWKLSYTQLEYTDIGMEFGIEKCSMLVMKSGKRQMTDGMELPNDDRIRTLEENENYKYLGIWEADTIKQVQMKDMIRKEYLRRTRKLLETKLSSRNLIKGINTWAVPLVRYSGPFLKWTREELKQMDQRTRKLMTMHKALRGCPRGVMVKAMNCGIVVREFVLQSRYYVHFRANTLGKGMNPLILPPTMGK